MITYSEDKGPHTCNDNCIVIRIASKFVCNNCIQSLELKVNLCVYGIIVLPKVVDFDFDHI